MTIVRKVLTTDDPLAADAELHNQRPGWAVMRARPNFREHGQVLWADLLVAIGHEVSSAPRGRAGSHSQSLAFCWLAAGSTTDLVVAGANMLPPRSLMELCSTSTAAGVRIWLLYDIETCDEREQAEANLAMTTEPLDMFLEARVASGTAEAVAGLQSFPVVSDIHFLGFLDAIAPVMTKTDRSLVQERFRQGRDAMQQRLKSDTGVDEHRLALHLHEITSSTNDLNELTALVKGAQAGAFLQGWYAQVDIRRWAERGMVVGLSLNLSTSDWATLALQHRPHEAATCVLSTLGFSVDAIPAVRANEVADDGSTVIKAGIAIEVPELARHLLVAQHIFRELVGTESDRFVVGGPKEPEVTDKWVGRLLRVVTRDTGVVLRGWNSSRKSLEGHTWTHRLGVSMTRLAA